MKVFLLTVIVAAALPETVLAQPTYLRQTTQTTRTRQVQRTEMVPQAEATSARQQNDARVEPEYRFTLSISITATGYQNGQKRENSVVTYYINPTENWVATPSICEQKLSKSGGCSGLVIYDVPASRMLFLNTREKSGVSVSMPSVYAAGAQRRRDLNLPPPGENGCKCDKTGKKKKIEGFLAEEWSCINPARKTRFDMWVTRDLKADLTAPGARTELNGFMLRAARVGGVPLEGYYFVNGDMISSLMLTDVNKKVQFKVKTTEYELDKGRN